MHLDLCSFNLSGLPLTFSIQTLHRSCCCCRGLARFSGVLIVSKLFLIGSGFLPAKFLVPPEPPEPLGPLDIFDFSKTVTGETKNLNERLKVTNLVQSIKLSSNKK